MGKLFGTDGIRGIAGEDLTCELAFKVGQSVGLVLAEELQRKALCYIGKDTRISSDMLEAALAAGVASVGADVLLLGVAPTPAVAFLTAKHADAGIVISASHNPFDSNGIKVFNREGYKLSDELEERVESLILQDASLPVKTGALIGRVFHDDTLIDRYVEHLAGCQASVPQRTGLKILFDCANGAASRTIHALAAKLPICADILFDKPDGVNINANCGSTHAEALAKRVVDGGYDAGILFDGDADRCLVVSEKGALMDGDRIMALCGLALKRKGKLPGDMIVATVMSNLGFHLYLKEHGLKAACTAVGDRHVLAHMLENGYMLGGEQSGHVIFLEDATTGDGQLTAVHFLNLLMESCESVSEMVAEIPQLPQVLRNIVVTGADKNALLQDSGVQAATRAAEDELGGEGRVLVRPSGTEALIRVMMEGREQARIEALADSIIQAIKEAM